jgi:NitT/TauT family transport system substrate-binding protein
MTDDKIAYAIKVMNDGRAWSCRAMPSTLGIGAMTDARWASFYESMAAVGVLPNGLTRGGPIRWNS